VALSHTIFSWTFGFCVEGRAGLGDFHSFWEYCPRANIRKKFKSSAHKFNGFVFHDNWLHNMLISTSMAGAK